MSISLRSSPRRPRTVLRLLAVLVAGLLLAGCAGTPDDDLAPVEAATPESQRPVLEEYLVSMRDFGPEKVLVGHELARRGDILVPELSALLAEVERDGDRYHLIRLSCIAIREGTIDVGAHPGLERALEEAQRAIPLGTPTRGYADYELRSCQQQDFASGAEDTLAQE